MIHIKTNSIRQKLLNWLLIFLLPLLLLGTVSAYYLANYFSNLAYDRALFRVALALADQIEVKNGQMVVDIPDSTLDLIEYDKYDWIYYQIQDANHQVVIGEENLTQPKHLLKAGQHSYYDSKFNDKSLRMVALNLPLPDLKKPGDATILIGETTTKRDRMAHEIIVFMLIPQFLLIVLVALLIDLGIRRGLMSLDKFKDLIYQRSPTDTRPLDTQAAPEELQPLLHAMNDLLFKVKGSVDERHQFIANAAHQLKTPLAGLKLQAEAALREDNIVSVHHALQQISSGSDNLARLATQLLSLARAEPEVNSQSMLPVDLVQLIKEVTAEWVPKALDKNIDLGVSCSFRQRSIIGNAVLLQELLNNLIDNAIRYNPKGTKVTVVLAMVKNEVVLSVQDNGLGLALNEQKQVFERFYRVLGSGENGCGLGLAIVREIATQHQARVELNYTDMEKSTGTTVKVIFQIPESSEQQS